MEIEKERVDEVLDEIIEKLLNKRQDINFTRIMGIFSLYHSKNKDREVMNQFKTYIEKGILESTMEDLITMIENGILELTMEQLIVEIEKGIDREIFEWTKSYNEQYGDDYHTGEDVLYRNRDEIDLTRTLLKLSEKFNLDKFKKKMKYTDYPNMDEFFIFKEKKPLLYTINAMAGILYRNEHLYIQHHKAIRKLEKDKWFMDLSDHFSFAMEIIKRQPDSFNNIIESFIDMFVLTYYYYHNYPVDD